MFGQLGGTQCPCWWDCTSAVCIREQFRTELAQGLLPLQHSSYVIHFATITFCSIKSRSKGIIELNPSCVGARNLGHYSLFLLDLKKIYSENNFLLNKHLTEIQQPANININNRSHSRDCQCSIVAHVSD